MNDIILYRCVKYYFDQIFLSKLVHLWQLKLLKIILRIMKKCMKTLWTRLDRVFNYRSRYERTMRARGHAVTGLRGETLTSGALNARRERTVAGSGSRSWLTVCRRERLENDVSSTSKSFSVRFLMSQS